MILWFRTSTSCFGIPMFTDSRTIPWEPTQSFEVNRYVAPARPDGAARGKGTKLLSNHFLSFLLMGSSLVVGKNVRVLNYLSQARNGIKIWILKVNFSKFPWRRSPTLLGGYSQISPGPLSNKGGCTCLWIQVTCLLILVGFQISSGPLLRLEISLVEST